MLGSSSWVMPDHLGGANAVKPVMMFMMLLHVACYEVDTDRPGGDLWHDKQPSAAACANACTDEPECEVWTWFQEIQGPGLHTICIRKSHAATSRPDECCISGLSGRSTVSALVEQSGTGIDFYSILKAPRSASSDDLKKAYRTGSKKWHPDKNPNNPEAHRLFAEFASAYATLGNSQLRSDYDALNLDHGLGKTAPPSESLHSANVHDCHSSEHVSSLIQGGKVVIHYYHPDCPHSARMAAKLEQAQPALLSRGYQLAAVNCAKDAAFQTCQEHQVFAVPMLRAGITKDQFVDAVGYQPMASIELWIDQLGQDAAELGEQMPLNASSFDTQVRHGMWMVHFHLGLQCGKECRADRSALVRTLEPHRGAIAIGTVDCTQNRRLCHQEGATQNDSSGVRRPLMLYSNGQKLFLGESSLSPSFSSMDNDGDGVLSHEEWQLGTQDHSKWEATLQGIAVVLQAIQSATTDAGHQMEPHNDEF